MTVTDLLPPLLAFVSFPVLQAMGAEEVNAFLIALMLGFGLRVWIALPAMVHKIIQRNWSLWLALILPLAMMGLVLLFQSPAAGLRVVTLYLVLRILVLALDMSDGSADVIPRLFAWPEVRPHDHVLTRVFILRDLAMILLAETVIATGSVPAILTLAVFWPVLHGFADRATLLSVLLVRQSEKAG